MSAFSRVLAGLSVTALILTGCGSGGGGKEDDGGGGAQTLQAVAGSSVDFIALVPLAAWEILKEEDGITVE